MPCGCGSGGPSFNAGTVASGQLDSRFAPENSSDYTGVAEQGILGSDFVALVKHPAVIAFAVGVGWIVWIFSKRKGES